MRKNKLGSMVKDMCVEYGIELKSNHSLCATGASALFQSNVPEKIIQKTTGHCSLDALCMYQKTSVEQHQAVSRLLMSTRPMSFQDQVSHQDPVQCRQCKPAEIGVASVFGNLTNCTIADNNVKVDFA